jgi:chaperonin cofactor prefoldin
MGLAAPPARAPRAASGARSPGHGRRQACATHTGSCTSRSAVLLALRPFLLRTSLRPRARPPPFSSPPPSLNPPRPNKQHTHKQQATLSKAPPPSTSAASPEVTPSDQAAINEFNRAFQKRKELGVRAAEGAKARANLEDAEAEVGLGDPDEAVRMVVGECFVHLDQATAEARLADALSAAAAEAEGVGAEVAALEARMGELKAGLYSKFGSSINLEE